MPWILLLKYLSGLPFRRKFSQGMQYPYGLPCLPSATAVGPLLLLNELLGFVILQSGQRRVVWLATIRKTFLLEVAFV